MFYKLIISNKLDLFWKQVFSYAWRQILFLDLFSVPGEKVRKGRSAERRSGDGKRPRRRKIGIREEGFERKPETKTREKGISGLK